MLPEDWIGHQGSRSGVLEPQVRGHLSLRGQRQQALGQRQQALRGRLRGGELALGGGSCRPETEPRRSRAT